MEKINDLFGEKIHQEEFFEDYKLLQELIIIIYNNLVNLPSNGKQYEKYYKRLLKYLLRLAKEVDTQTQSVRNENIKIE